MTGTWEYSKAGNNADQWLIYDESGRTIGLSYHGEDNARVMANGPNLIEALETIANIDYSASGDVDTIRLARHIAKCAITNVKGES